MALATIPQPQVILRPKPFVKVELLNCANVAQSWKLNDLQCVTVLPLSKEMQSACVKLKLHTLNANGLPKTWAYPLVSQGSGTAFRSFDTITGRFDITLSSQFRPTPIEVVDSLSLLMIALNRLMVSAGFCEDMVKRFRFSLPVLKVNCVRCQRTPFVFTRNQAAPPFEDFLIVLPLDSGNPIGFWDQNALKGVDGSPVVYIPMITTMEAVIFTETPFTLLSTLQTDGGQLSSSFIMIRACLTDGFTSSMNPHFFGPEVWNAGPENWLQTATIQPPVALCCICRGYIRERRHGDLSGSRDVNRDHQCTGFHCTACALQNVAGGHMVCEMCMNVQHGPLPQIDVTLFHARDDTNFNFRVQQHFFSEKSPCFHSHLRNNDLIDTLFLLIRPSELQVAAAAWREFLMNGTWIASLIPDKVSELVTLNRFEELWPAFYQEIFLNAHCPRVVALNYAMQCGLNTGPLMQRQDRCRASERELFFSGSLRSNWNHRGIHECVRDRIILASEFAVGLFERGALMRMAIRVFRLFNIPKFQSNFQCLCTSPQYSDTRDYSTTICQGPVLDLSRDKGQDHVWPTLSASLRSDTRENLRVLRNFQRSMRVEMKKYPLVFDARRHVKCPNL